MTLADGSRLGLYEILAPLGAGGMGEVYRARDAKLGRDVAVKVLPEHFAEDKERMARFEREARVLASLNHPNIAAVYGLEEDEGSQYLVMELVPGESLAARIQRGPLSVEETVRIARQLIDALEAAHESGVVHRDLKPANVQLTPDGHVKVLDFGLAKVETGEMPSTETSLSPTMTRDGTQAGIILGTAPYMSPEQARGLPVDKRSDIFSFGCVVFEMLTGRKAFEGELVSDVMASVIKSEPDLSLVPRPAGHLRKLLERCLEKQPKSRLRDIGDARVELEEDTPVLTETVVQGRGRAVVLAGAAFLVGAAVTGLILARSATSPEPRGGVTRLRYERRVGGPLAVSPDGGTIVQSSGQSGLRLRRLDSWEDRRLLEGRSTEEAFFSPDGEWLGFLNGDDGGLYKISVSGGAPVRLAALPEYTTGASWTDKDTILISAAGGVWEVEEDGGTLRPLVSLPEGQGALAPTLLPGGAAVLFHHVTSRDETGDSRGESVAVYDLRSGELETLVPDGLRPRYVRTGHIVYVSGSTLMAQPFDVATLALTGGAVPAIEAVDVGVSRRLNGASTYARYEVSSSGTLAYLPSDETASGGRSLVRVTPSQGGDARVNVINAQVSRDVRVSPDGSRVAAHDMGGENDVWVYELERGTMSRLTLEPGEDETPVWSPDGRDIAYAGRLTRRTVFRSRADGSEPPVSLWETDYHVHVHDWTRDGKWLLLDVDIGPNFDVWILDAAGESDAQPLLDSRFNEMLPRVSPDGRHIAYVSDESGSQEVYVQRFPDLGEKRQISNEGGGHPIWSRDGETLFYRSATHVMSVDVRVGDILEFSIPEAVFEDTFFNPAGSHGAYDVMPDGSFIMLANEDTQSQEYIHVVVNWFDELDQHAPR